MNPIQKCIYPFARVYLLQVLTNHLGSVIETKDKIICYVKPSMVKEQFFDCTGIHTEEENITHFFHMNKPIYYVFQNMKFSSFPYINGCGEKNVNLLIKNCDFPYGASIVGFDKCVMKDTQIVSNKNLFINADKVSFKNVVMENQFVQIEANEMIMSFSQIGTENEEKSKVSFSAEKAKFLHSQIYGRNIDLYVSQLNLQNSCLHEKEDIEIHTNELIYTKKK